jgi:hypothetical protein
MPATCLVFWIVNRPLTATEKSWGMKLLLPLLILVGCGASPDPKFFGASRHEVTVEGINFVVFHKDTRAEVVRLGYLRRAARTPVPRLMASAAAQATGCQVIANSMKTRIPGDTGEAKFDLDC